MQKRSRLSTNNGVVVMLKLDNLFGVFASKFIAGTEESVTLLSVLRAGYHLWLHKTDFYLLEWMVAIKRCLAWGHLVHKLSSLCYILQLWKKNVKLCFIRKVTVIDRILPVRPLPALQCTAATFLESADSQLWTSSQNGCISSMFGGVWSSNAYRATWN